MPWRVENPYNFSSYGTIRRLYGRHRICLQARSQRHMRGGVTCCQQVRRPLHQHMSPRNAPSSGGLSRAPRGPPTATNASGIATRACALSVPSLYGDHTIRSGTASIAAPHTWPQSPSSRGIRQKSARFCARPCYEHWVL